jgi:hypothetical protein
MRDEKILSIKTKLMSDKNSICINCKKECCTYSRVKWEKQHLYHCPEAECMKIAQKKLFYAYSDKHNLWLEWVDFNGIPEKTLNSYFNN